MAAELRELCRRLNIPNVFYGLKAGMQLFEERARNSIAQILTLDSQRRNTSSIGFDNPKEAEERYLELEKANKDKPHIQTVLVMLGSIKALRKTYPSFYLDTTRFIRIIEKFCDNVDG